MTYKKDVLKADTIRNPYKLAQWLANKYGGKRDKYLPAIMDKKNQEGSKSNPVANQKAIMKKLGSAAMGALAGWWLGGEIADITRGMGQPTPAQQREFERQIQQAMRKKGKNIKKADGAFQKLQMFFSSQTDASDTYVRRTPVKNAVQPDEDLQKKLSFPPYAGARFDPTSHRWTKPENYGQTYAARGGKKRVRGSGTGAHERSVSGHGKGRIRGEGAGAKGKGETHLSAQRRKEGFTHSDLTRHSKHKKK